MDALTISIFQDGATELNTFVQSPPPLDFTDQPLSQAQIQQFCLSAAFFCTSPVPEQGYRELEFNMANDYWGINMNFGNDQNGVQLRQGIAHLIDKTKFTTNEQSIAGLAAAIDNPIPSNSSFNGVVLPTPNPCGWDTLYTQSGSQCVNGAQGGNAYNCAIGASCPTGTLGPIPPHTWQAQIGSADFCAAATHFMNALNNGVLISSKGVHLNASCELLAPGLSTVGVGWPANVTSNRPNLFARLDDAPRLAMGDSYSQEICALWTGSYATGCDPFLSVSHGTITSFCGFFTSTTGISECWWMYTAAFSAFPFDASIYLGYNSQFVSGGAWDHPTCKSNTPTPAANNYEYVCNSAYDTASAGVEFPADGTVATAFTNAQTALNIFGQGAFTIPVFTLKDEFAYLSNWHRAINGDGVGTPNFFTWLNAWTPTPSSACRNIQLLFTGLCIRQGFSQPTRSLSPYIASSSQDLRVLRNLYDSLGIENPASNGQLLDWMTIRTQELSNSVLGYTPPTGTTDNFRFTLRPDLFWQNGLKVTAWDVQFSLASFLATGAFIGAGLAPLLPPSGACNNTPPASIGNCADQITVLTPTQFDVHVYNHGPFTQLGLSTTPLFPGRYWSAAGKVAWDNCVAVGSCPVSVMSADPGKLGFTFDPMNEGIFIGSGAWKCIDLITTLPGPIGGLGFGCTSTGLQNPPPGGSYTFFRFGIGNAPGASVTDAYFRSSGTFALYLWSGNTGDPVGDPLNFSRLASCFGQPVGLSGCSHWQEGIGNPGAPAGSGNLIGGIQASIVLRFLFLNWVSPFDAHHSPPQGMAPFDPILYEGSFTLNPASMAGCALPANGLPTVPGYPNGGGYDC
jgi:hypothetical protein